MFLKISLFLLLIREMEDYRLDGRFLVISIHEKKKTWSMLNIQLWLLIFSIPQVAQKFNIWDLHAFRLNDGRFKNLSTWVISHQELWPRGKVHSSATKCQAAHTRHFVNVLENARSPMCFTALIQTFW